MPQTLPGSHKQRNRARKLLNATLTSPAGQWLVNGGENDHIVMTDPNGESFDYACDCWHWNEKFSPCCHIIRVMMTLEPERLIFTPPVRKQKNLRQRVR